MKIKLLSVLLLFFVVELKAQNYDQRLLQVYSASSLEQMERNAPGTIDYLNFYVANSYQFIVKPEGKDIPTQELNFVDLQTGAVLSYTLTPADLDQFNPYLFNCKPGIKHTYYTIGTQGKILMMLSQSEIERRYKKHLESQKR
jgi:hypothetical protein